MATLNPIVVSPPSPVPAGQSALVTLSFTLSSGTPDRNVLITVTEDGVTEGTAPLVLKGLPGETTPQVQIGNTGKGWEIQASGATLVANSSVVNTFTLS